MASLISAVAKAIRRRDEATLAVLADLCEERELYGIARGLRHTDTVIQFEALERLWKSVRRKERPRANSVLPWHFHYQQWRKLHPYKIMPTALARMLYSKKALPEPNRR